LETQENATLIMRALQHWSRRTLCVREIRAFTIPLSSQITIGMMSANAKRAVILRELNLVIARFQKSKFDNDGF